MLRSDKIFDTIPRSVGSLTLSNAFKIAFIILSRENFSFEPSRLVIVKFLISIAIFSMSLLLF